MSKGATVKIRNFMEWLYFSIKRKNKYINNMEFDAKTCFPPSTIKNVPERILIG